MLLHAARSALFHLTIIKNEKERNTQNAELGRQDRACINVQFSNSDFAF